MDNFVRAIAATLMNEGGFRDRRPVGTTGKDIYGMPATGEVVNMGITHWFLRSIGVLPAAPYAQPASDVEVAFVRQLARDRVVGLYHTYFWTKMHCDELPDLQLSYKVFDLDVNTGKGTEFMQQAVNKIIWPEIIAVDNAFGPATLARVTALDPVLLRTGVIAEAGKFYRALAIKPEYAGSLAGWLKRLDTTC